MSKQDRVYIRTPSALEQKYDWGKTFGEVYGLAQDAQKVAERALNAVEGLDRELDQEEIFNRLTNYGTVQGIYRGDNDDIYINASYIKSGTLAADRVDADNLKVKAANITGLLTAAQIKLGGKMALYQAIDSDVSAGSLGYMDVSVSKYDGSPMFSGSAFGIEASNHAILLAPHGNVFIASYADIFIGSSFGIVNMSGRELKFNGKAIMERLTAFENAFTFLGVEFNWQNDG